MNKVTSVIAVFVITFFCISGTNAQEIWEKTSLKGQELKENKTGLSEGIVLYALDVQGLKSSLMNAPERTSSAVTSGAIISLPLTNGEMMEFYVVEASNFAPELAAKFPEIKSYRGASVKDGSINLSFSLSQLGLKAMITGVGNKSIFIEPVTENNAVYASYSRVVPNKGDSFSCLTEEENEILNKTYEKVGTEALNADDQTLRTFRLALSVTGEYTEYFGGTVADAMAAINATMTRVNAIFERDFAINMELIANNEDVIYTNAMTDPYSDASGMDAWNGELQSNLNTTIGFSNYDIGHLFGASGGGGNAGCIGCVCEAGKGSAYTSPGTGGPEGDAFDIDFVAHEMGHQFGANHTFSRSEGSGANLEPGSGTTIMGYAGVASDANIQQHSDDFFHYYSIYQVTSNVETKSCPEITTLTNTPPSVDAGADYTIPSGTAFKLTANAMDTDGDDISYSWEQADVSTASTYTFPNANATTGPLFRVGQQPLTSPVRYFPSFDKVLNGNLNSTWEPVPNVGRNLNFVVQVRDNNTNIGQTASDNNVITVDDSNGAFKITGMAENDAFPTGSTLNLTWDVAGTDAAPFNSPTVNIKMSTDGGETFADVATGIANDGNEDIVLPAETSEGAYIMVESVGNVFYAVSPRFLVGLEAEIVCNTYEVTLGSLPAAIPDGIGQNQPGDYVAVGFEVPDLGEIYDMNITVAASHTYVSDMYIMLQAPSVEGEDPINTIVWDRECTDKDDINITFDDDGNAITCASPTTGTYQPSESLSIFNGMDAQGNWLIGAWDFYNQDTGSLDNAVLEVCTIDYVTLSAKNPNAVLSNFEVYPNPTSNIINVKFAGQVEQVSYKLYDMLGRTIYAQNDTTVKTIDISNFPTGVYLLEISAGDATTTKKIIKE